jgi:sortase A
MKKKTIMITLSLIVTMTMLTSIPALAMETVEGPEAGPFGKPTSVTPDIIVGGHPTESDNINRSKDSAFIPPPFGSPESYTIGSGDPLTPGLSEMPALPGSSSGGATYTPADSDGFALPPTITESSSGGGYSSKFTLPDGMYYSDGSIGTLSIPRLGVSSKVYEEESLENMTRGIGHFKSTSCWDGNAGFAAHNRNGIFGQIHTLKNGDRIIYTTKLGTRTYEVFFVGQVHETDFSRLGRTDENLVTLITCVRDVRDMRVCVQAREVT